MEHTEVKPILSILICHLFNRFESFNKLTKKLDQQIKKYDGSVFYRWEGDNGQSSIGAKRNRLLSRAEGEYVCFIDDDDDISDDYVDSIMKALESRPDCVGMQGLLKCSQGEYLFEHSIQYQGWYTQGPASNPHYFRTPNHLNPVKRAIARMIGFPLVNNGEDGIYSNAIRKYLKTEVYINHPIYYYLTEIRS